jgi:small subunit ribosomal protein S14
MAKTSVVYRNKHRESLVAQKKELRARLKADWLNPAKSEEERAAAYLQLQKMPRDSSAVRLRIRCALTGRPRGVFRRFGVSRGKLREMIMNGEVPGVIKSSW